MDNSKVLKPIIGPQESAESKKKESSKKKKALLVSALAFLISTGTIAASIAAVRANMPKLEIKFDDWFVDSFDQPSMQAFIDENRLSKGDIDKELPGYVDKKAKDQNVKNADMITNARLTNRIPEDKNNKLPHGIYVEMTAETNYAFAYQANLSLEDNNENTKLTNLTEDSKKQKYYISKDKSKLYVLVYERASDSDESLPNDLQTFNNFKISNCPEALRKLNKYIADQSRRYTAEEFEQSDNWKPGLDVFRNALIGLESNYVKDVGFDYDTDNNTPGGSNQKVMKIFLDNERSNFEFIDANETYGSVSYNEETGTLTIRNLEFYREKELVLDDLQEKLQEYIKQYNETENEGRYTLEEFKTKMGDDTLRQLIAKSLGVGEEITITPPEPEVPENPDTEENGTSPLADPTTPPNTTIDISKIKNLYMSGSNLVIELKCDDKQKYSVPKNYSQDKYSFDQANDRLTVKNLKYYTEYKVSNTQKAFENLDKKIVDITSQFTVNEFKTFVEGETTKEQCKKLIANGLRANDKAFNANLIKELTFTKSENSETKGTLTITFDNEFKKYKTIDGEQFEINKANSTLDITLTFFKQVEINQLKEQIQLVIDSETGTIARYTVEEFEEKINENSSSSLNELQDKIREIVETRAIGSKDVSRFKYNKDDNELTFNVTIPKYEKFPLNGDDIKYEALKKNQDDTTTYKVTVQNLEYWKDLIIEKDDLIKTKNNVNKFILDNFITIANDDPTYSVYNEYKDEIYKLFEETPVSDGTMLSNYMTNDTDKFKRELNNIEINLKSEVDKVSRLRGFNAINLPNEGINFDTNKKILTFENLEFCSSKEFFQIDETAREIRWVNEKGRKQKVLRTPPGYNMDLPNPASNPQAQYAFAQLKLLEKFFMDDAVTKIPQGLFYYCHKLQYAKMSKNLEEWKWPYSIYKAPNLSFVDWTGVKKLKKMGTYGYAATGVKDILLPRSIEEISSYSFQTMSYNPNTYPKIHFNSIITWAKKFGYAIASDQPKVSALVLLADEIIPSSSSVFTGLSAKSQNLNIYVKSEDVKTKLTTETKFGLQGFDSDKIHVIPNLEDILMQQGIIPSGW